MQFNKGDRFSAIDDAAILDNGETVVFTIKASTGKQMRLNCEVAQLGDIISAFAQLAKAAGEKRDVPEPTTSDGPNYLVPIPADGIGFQLCETPDKTLVVVRLAGFDLAFEVESSGLMRIADDVARIAKTLSASGKKIQ